MQSVSIRVRRAGLLFTLMVVLAVPMAYADGPNDPLEGRIVPPTPTPTGSSATIQGRIVPPTPGPTDGLSTPDVRMIPPTPGPIGTSATSYRDLFRLWLQLRMLLPMV